jgi:hypothetical protein
VEAPYVISVCVDFRGWSFRCRRRAGGGAGPATSGLRGARTEPARVHRAAAHFTEAEDVAFWPNYREYEAELARYNDERLAAFETYTKVYDKLTPDNANELMVKVLDLEARRAALKQKFYGKLKSALSPLTAAKVLQIENQIALLIDLQIAAALPVAQ